MFDLQNCTSTVKWASTNSPTDQLGSDICIDIKEFDSAKISQRYSSLTCNAAVTSKISNYY